MTITMNIKDIKNKFQYNSPVILTFTLISLLVYFMGYITNGYTTEKVFVLYKTSLLSPMQYVRMFTHILGHATWDHFLNNFTIILLVGPMIEEKYGSKCVLQMIGLTAIVTSILNITLFPQVALLGASGVAFMMVLLGSFVNIQKGKIPITFIIIVLFFMGTEIITGVIQRDNISQFAHIIGGACGSLFGYWYNRK